MRDILTVQPTSCHHEESKRELAPTAAGPSLTRRTVRGAVASTTAQIVTILFRIGSLIVLARLLLKEDFGLVNMVTAFAGILGLLRDAGLSMATVQRDSLTQAQTSTLFWINLAVGVSLALLAGASAPLITVFYGEPRLFWVTVAMGTSFIFHGAAVQHRAMLQRAMCFVKLSVIDAASFLASIGVAISMALLGCGYWALVAMTIGPALFSLPVVWWASEWTPGLPRRRSGIRPMLLFGSKVTLANLVYYAAYNADKVLVGRFFGAGALGIYGRAYQLVNLPTETFNATIGLVGFPALSRVQNEPMRVRTYFLNGYTVFVSLVVPITVACILFANDIILVLLGPKWQEAAGLFRLLAPTILAFALINPFSWLMLSGGRGGRYLQIPCALIPALMLGYTLSLPYGPSGIAATFSTTMALSVVPLLWWARQGTLVTMRDVLKAVAPSAICSGTGIAVALVFQPILEGMGPALARLFVECTIFLGVYVLAQVLIMQQKPMYLTLLKELGFMVPFGRRQ